MRNIMMMMRHTHNFWKLDISRVCFSFILDVVGANTFVCLGEIVGIHIF